MTTGLLFCVLTGSLRDLINGVKFVANMAELSSVTKDRVQGLWCYDEIPVLKVNW